MATSDGGDPVVLRWRRRFDEITTSVSVSPVTQSYSSSSGRAYTISTILLCDLDFGDVGMYVCDVVGTNAEEIIQVTVHSEWDFIKNTIEPCMVHSKSWVTYVNSKKINSSNI